LLKRHLLQGILEVSWIHPATGEMADDTQFFSALQELMAYAFEEYERQRSNQWRRRGTSDRPGILEEMQALLQHYRAELLAESGRLLQEGAT
jgi:acyl-CoA reductase-like NAD-dependent aldehyde dehydrogenase